MAGMCPECGATLEGYASCQEIFDAFLVLEFTDPGYGEVHFLTVACFMVQHGRYSPEGLAWIAGQLRRNLEDGVPAATIRKEAARETGQNVRTWKVSRRPGDPPQPPVAWSLTIADVAEHYADPSSYREWVTRWARATLAEMQPLLGK